MKAAAATATAKDDTKVEQEEDAAVAVDDDELVEEEEAATTITSASSFSLDTTRPGAIRVRGPNYNFDQRRRRGRRETGEDDDDISTIGVATTTTTTSVITPTPTTFGSIGPPGLHQATTVTMVQNAYGVEDYEALQARNAILEQERLNVVVAEQVQIVVSSSIRGGEDDGEARSNEIGSSNEHARNNNGRVDEGGSDSLPSSTATATTTPHATTASTTTGSAQRRQQYESFAVPTTATGAASWTSCVHNQHRLWHHLISMPPLRHSKVTNQHFLTFVSHHRGTSYLKKR